MRSRGIHKGFIFIAILIAAIALFSLIFSPTQKPDEIPLSEAITMSQNGEIEKIVVEEDALLITTKDGTELKTYKEAYATIYEIEGLNLEGVVVEVKGSSGFNWGIFYYISYYATTWDWYGYCICVYSTKPSPQNSYY